MKKEHIWTILLFGGLWGICEVMLGGWLYANSVKCASAPLTIIAISLLSFSRLYISKPGAATLIAAFAMLYKFLNSPFFACHMLGILLLGVSFDICFSYIKIRNLSIKAAISTYLGYIAFALMITYVFRYHYWVEGGLAKVAKYIFVSGTMSAIGAAVISPAAMILAEKVKQLNYQRVVVLPRLAGCLIWLSGIYIFIS